MFGSFNKIMRSIASNKGDSELEKRLIKATYGSDSKEPKEKHVIYLLTAMHSGLDNMTPSQIAFAIQQRATNMSESSSVIMKTLIVFHRILQDKLLTPKLIDAKQVHNFEYPMFEKDSNQMGQNDRVISMISRQYSQYLEDLTSLFKDTKCKSLTRDSGTAEALYEKMSKKSVLKFSNKLRSLLNKLEIQLEHKEFCTKTRLLSAYLTNVFQDYVKAYVMYASALKILKRKFTSFSVEKRNKVLDQYSFGVRFTTNYKKLTELVPIVFDIKFKAPVVDKPSEADLEKLHKKLNKTPSSESTKVVAYGSWIGDNELAARAKSQKVVTQLSDLEEQSKQQENDKESDSSSKDEVLLDLDYTSVALVNNHAAIERRNDSDCCIKPGNTRKSVNSVKTKVSSTNSQAEDDFPVENFFCTAN